MNSTPSNSKPAFFSPSSFKPPNPSPKPAFARPEHSPNIFALARHPPRKRAGVLAASTPPSHPTHALEDLLTEFRSTRFDDPQLSALLAKVPSFDASQFCVQFVLQALHRATFADCDHIVLFCLTWLAEASPPGQVDEEQKELLKTEFSRRYNKDPARRSFKAVITRNWGPEFYNPQLDSIPFAPFPPVCSTPFLQLSAALSTLCKDYRKVHHALYQRWLSRTQPTENEPFVIFRPGKGETMLNMADLQAVYDSLKEPTGDILADVTSIRTPQLGPILMDRPSESVAGQFLWLRHLSTLMPSNRRETVSDSTSQNFCAKDPLQSVSPALDTTLVFPATDRMQALADCSPCPPGFKRAALGMLDESRVCLLPSSRIDLLLPCLNDLLPCHQHLRLVAAAAGLTTNHSNAILISRLRDIADQGHFAFLQRHRDTLVVAAPHRQVGHLPNLCKYRFEPPPDPHWNFAIVLDHYVGRNARQIWEDRGTLTVPNVVPHLHELRASIDAEFKLYGHHYRTPAAQKGWLRNMFYSLTQQIIRCDPLVYALHVALRPDQNHRLVSHPYITKDADPATTRNSGFLHLDANLAQLAAGGPGSDRLTCGISLDDEDERNCTIVVHGSHRKTSAILSRLQHAGLENKTPALTTDFGKTWGPHLAAEFGKPTPVPVKKYGLRISHVGVVHGSTPNISTRRRLVLPWLMAFGPDYKAPDVLGAATWSELANQHLHCIPPSREPSGQTPRSPLPPVLPWSVPLHPSHAIGRALLGQIKYEDPMVVNKMTQLFHPDKAVSRAYLARVRSQAVVDFANAWAVVQALELRATGPTNSYLPLASSEDQTFPGADDDETYPSDTDSEMDVDG